MKYIALLLCFPIALSLKGQQNKINYEVSGLIIEKLSGRCVPYATIILKNDSINEKKMQACDALGLFTINVSTPQTYILTVTAVGFKEFNRTIEVSESKTDLGRLAMEEGTEIKEITITAQKPLVKIEVDKIIYSMESDPEAQTNNTLEMLSRVPLITVDAEENITLNGQSNFKILINGKSSSMMSGNLKDVLKSLPANTIRDIEVITNPSTKYDAEGIGGIINIITIRKVISGYNGSVSAGVDSKGSYSWNAYLAAKIKKFSFSLQYYSSQYKQLDARSNGSSEYFNNSDFHYANYNGNHFFRGLASGLSGEASYDIDSLNLISISFRDNENTNRNGNITEMRFSNTANEITRMYENSLTGTNYNGSLSGNIDYQRLYKKPDKSLTFSYKLDNSPRSTENSTDIIGITNYPTYCHRSENNAVGREQTLQVDYYDPLTKVHQIEGGLKFILRQNISKSETFRNDTIRLENINDLDYNQYILGAYLGYVVKWKKFSAKSGLRLERTWNDGVSKTSGVNMDFTNRLINLVPYITFSFMPKQGQSLRLSYTQRLSRPGIWYLNPYVNDVDSMNISFGNPSLKAEVSNAFEMGYTYFTPKFNFSIASYASFVNNSIERISKIQTSGATVSSYQNIGKNQRYGLYSYLSYRPNGKFNIYLNAGVNYSKFEATSDYFITNEGYGYNGSLGGRVTLWKDGSLNINGGMNSSGIRLQGTSSNYYYTSIGFSQYFFKRKLMFSASASDPFWLERKFVNESADITFITHSEYIQLARIFRFNLRYNFGKMDLQVKKARRGIQNDDLKNGGTESGG